MWGQSKTKNGYFAAYDAVYTPHGWPTNNPVAIGTIWTTSKLKCLVGTGIWDAITGEYLFYNSNPDFDLIDKPFDQ